MQRAYTACDRLDLIGNRGEKCLGNGACAKKHDYDRQKRDRCDIENRRYFSAGSNKQTRPDFEREIWSTI
jgi:hypothetical protein